MAVLSEADRARIWRGLMRYASRELQEVALSKSDLRAAIDATDDWVETNQGAFNSALPAAAQSSLTVAQKTLLFCVVAAMRVDPQFARRLVGEVD